MYQQPIDVTQPGQPDQLSFKAKKVASSFSLRHKRLFDPLREPRADRRQNMEANWVQGLLMQYGLLTIALLAGITLKWENNKYQCAVVEPDTVENSRF